MTSPWAKLPNKSQKSGKKFHFLVEKMTYYFCHGNGSNTGVFWV
jgi:hypothetical protein